jgi:hypothetical protein
MNGLKSLLVSRKFWLTALALVQIVVCQYFEVPDAVWQSIAGLVAVLVAAIAGEDMATKRSPR